MIADTDLTVINAFGVPTHAIPVLGTIATRQAFLIKDGKIVVGRLQGRDHPAGCRRAEVLAAQGS